MAIKAGFTHADFNRLKGLAAEGYFAREISAMLSIRQENVEAALETLKPPEPTPAQKGAATRAKKKIETEKAKEEIPKHPNFM